MSGTKHILSGIVRQHKKRKQTMIQVFGKKKSAGTRKASRFLKERAAEFQFVDITEKMISAGELSHVLQFVEPGDLVDTQSTYYKKNGYDYLDYDPVEEILEHPELMRLPIVRGKKLAFVGYDEQKMLRLLEQES
jgi:arsenate reductase-like glutaredoxin family protein